VSTRRAESGRSANAHPRAKDTVESGRQRMDPDAQPKVAAVVIGHLRPCQSRGGLVSIIRAVIGLALRVANGDGVPARRGHDRRHEAYTDDSRHHLFSLTAIQGVWRCRSPRASSGVRCTALLRGVHYCCPLRTALRRPLKSRSNHALRRRIQSMKTACSDFARSVGSHSMATKVLHLRRPRDVGDRSRWSRFSPRVEIEGSAGQS